MTKVRTKPAKADRKDWNKYIDELRKETADCLAENLVP
jgi:hypothetical protein